MTELTKEELDGFLNNPELPDEAKVIIEQKIKGIIALVEKIQSDSKVLAEEKKELKLQHTLCKNERAALQEELKTATHDIEKLTNNNVILLDLKDKFEKQLTHEQTTHSELKQKHKLVTEAYTELKEQYDEFYKKFVAIKEKAGKYDEIKKNFKLPPNFEKNN